MQSLPHCQYDLHGCNIAVAHLKAASSPTGPPLVWIHGLGAASTMTFAEVARHPTLALVESVLVDLPGAGMSAAPADWRGTIEDLAEVVLSTIATMSEVPVVLFGHSLGGSVAIAAATQRPDLVRRLIVAEPNLDPGVGSTSVTIALQTEDEFVTRGYQRLVDATGRLARQGYADAGAWLLTLRLADPRQLHRAATSLLAAREPTFRQQLIDLPMPVATISGDRTPVLAPPLPQRANLQGYVVPDAGHQMFDDNPDNFAATLAGIVSPDVHHTPSC